MWDYRAQYLGNHDGDTVRVLLDKGGSDYSEWSIRLLGVFAPELSQPGGPECRAFVQAWFEARASTTSRWTCVVTTARMKVADREQKTLDRYVGTVASLDGTENLNLEVLGFIASKGYGGGTGAP